MFGIQGPIVGDGQTVVISGAGVASIPAGGVGTAQLAAGAVTAAKVAADVATQAELDVVSAAQAGTAAALAAHDALGVSAAHGAVALADMAAAVVAEHIFLGGNQNNGLIGAGSTVYLVDSSIGVVPSATEAMGHRLIVLRAGVIDMLRAVVEGAGTGTLAITVRKNGVDTTLLIAATAGPGVGATATRSDLVNSFAVVAGDVITVKLVTVTSAQSVKSCVVRFYPT